eukprot:4461091-Pyramimonas_sp.AAC.1
MTQNTTGCGASSPPRWSRNIARWGPPVMLSGRSWALLEPSWSPPGPLLGLCWATSEPPGGLRSPSEIFGLGGMLGMLRAHLELSCGGLKASWRH